MIVCFFGNGTRNFGLLRFFVLHVGFQLSLVGVVVLL